MIFNKQQQEQYMIEALAAAQEGADQGEVPIGAILVNVNSGEIIAKTHNKKEEDQVATHHAEILAIQEVNLKLKSWRLDEYALFVNVEPCLMCAGAIVQSRIKEVYYGIDDPKFGAVNSLYKTLNDRRANHEVEVQTGILAAQSRELMQNFFQSIRQKNKGK